jgi:DHA2 family multidrug resistance protein
VRLDARRPRPLVRFGQLAQARHLVGLGVFGLSCVVLGANNTMLPVLLQKALGMPQEIVGRHLGMGGLAGVASWIVLSGLLPRKQGPTRCYLVGFSALVLCGWQLSHLGESANATYSVVPALLCNGAFVITVCSPPRPCRPARRCSMTRPPSRPPTRSRTCSRSSASPRGRRWRRCACSGAAPCASRASAKACRRRTRPCSRRWAQLTRHFATTRDAAGAPQLALAHIGLQAAQRATLMAALDCFVVLFLVASTCLALVVVERMLRRAPLRKGMGAR